METLRGIYLDLGFNHVSTYLQSGNVLFDSPEQDHALLAKQIELRLKQHEGYTVSVFIRGADELQRLLTGNPFLNRRTKHPSKLHVTFLYHPPSTLDWNNLALPETTDEFALGENAIYLFCPNGYAKTRISNAYFERKLTMPVTTRNWNTVSALSKMVMD